MVDMLASELRGDPEKQDPPRPDFLLTLSDGRRVAVEIVEAMDEAIRKGYAGARRRIVHQVTDGMKERSLAANVSLSIPHGFVAELGALPGKVQRATSARIVDLVAEALATPLGAGHHGWLYEDGEPDERPAKNQLQYVGDLSSRGIPCVGWIAVYPWHEAVVLTAVSGIGPGPNLIQEAIDRKAVKRESYEIDARAEGDLVQLAKLRRTESAAVLARFQTWLYEQATLKSLSIGNAAGYVVANWDRLTRFVDDPRVPLDNNATERGIRGPVVGRKNHYGSKSRSGTQVASIFYSLIETAKLHDIDPAAYLRAAILAADRGDLLLPRDMPCVSRAKSVELATNDASRVGATQTETK